MPDLGQLIGGVVGVIGEQIGSSSLRLGPLPTLAILAAGIVLLSLLARPPSRWATRDLGRLASVRRAMALAAEAAGGAVFVMGGAGVARATSAFERMQTLAALPILGHVARAAARSGIPITVRSNDPIALLISDAVLLDAHRRTETEERSGRSRSEFVGEGRPALAGAALAEARPVTAAFAVGSLGEEAMLVIDGVSRGADWATTGTATAAQGPAVLLAPGGSLLGPELYQAPSDLGSLPHERAAVLAANRLIVISVVVILAASLIGAAGGVDVAPALAGR